MKWAKIGKKGDKKSPDEYASYEFYPDQKSLDKEFEIDRSTGKLVPNKAQSHLWVHYELGDAMLAESQRDYEMFVGGYMFYYDNIVRNKAVEHKIYFEWLPKMGDKTFSVAIFLSPKPYKAKRTSQVPMFSKTSVNALEGATMDNANNKTFALAEPEVAMMEKDGVSDGLSIDPPPIPPPPPPPRD